METIQLHACKVALDDNGIVICTPSESQDITGDDASEIINALGTLSKKLTIPVLVDHTVSHSLSYDAMRVLSEGKFTSVVAFLCKTPINMKTVKYFIETGRPNYPVESFTDRNSAIEWLSTYR